MWLTGVIVFFCLLTLVLIFCKEQDLKIGPYLDMEDDKKYEEIKVSCGMSAIFEQKLEFTFFFCFC